MGASGQPGLSLGALPALLYLLEDKEGSPPRSCFERLATLPLSERPLLLVCLEKTDPHTRILWGAQYVTPFFARATPEDGTVLVFARDVRLGHLMTTVKVKTEWLMVEEVADPLVVDMYQALVSTGSEASRLPDMTATSNNFAVAKVTIAPLSLVHPLLMPPFLTSVNV